MESPVKTNITVQVKVKAPVEKVWQYWTSPGHITKWNQASKDWHTTHAENDLQKGGKFSYRMEAKDGSTGFDFKGSYRHIEKHRQLLIDLDDGRNLQVTFNADAEGTTVTETFEAETVNSPELQKQGWQAILESFKSHAESQGTSPKLHFEIEINERASLVYRNLCDDRLYREWTSVFNPTSHFEGSWQKGSKILFIGTDKEGNRGGMVSRIKENIPNKFISIEHLGIIKKDREILDGPEVESWAGSLENYTFSENNGKTVLSVDMDSNEAFESYFQETWPKALKKFKEICER